MKPLITSIRWLAAADVLPSEPVDFTPWLAANLDLLGDALGFEDLTAIETEADAAGKRIDIVAVGIDSEGIEIPVVIENQYGETDHKHLGQIVTYLAQQENGVGVWLAERFSDAHRAAIAFLNRTSDSSVGYVLATVRFAPAPGDNAYYAHFELVERPNRFVQETKKRPAPQSQAGGLRRDYLHIMFERIRNALEVAGFEHVRMHARGSYIQMELPNDWSLHALDCHLKIRVNRQAASVSLYVSGFETREENGAALDVLKERIGAPLELDLGDVSVEWHAGDSDAKRDHVRIEKLGLGYTSSESEAAAQWTLATAGRVIRVLAQQSFDDLAGEVAERTSVEP